MRWLAAVLVCMLAACTLHTVGAAQASPHRCVRMCANAGITSTRRVQMGAVTSCMQVEGAVCIEVRVSAADIMAAKASVNHPSILPSAFAVRPAATQRNENAPINHDP